VTAEILTVAELAVVLLVKPVTIYSLVAKRALPFFRLRGSIRFSREALNEYIIEQAELNQKGAPVC
jgi:excisionase family DNA binding protein